MGMRRLVLLLSSMAAGVLLTSRLALAYPEFALARVNPKDFKGSLEWDLSSGAIVALLSVGVAIAGVVMTRLNARRQEVGVDQWRRDLRDWASEAIEVLSKARYAAEEYMPKPDASSSDLRSDLRSYVAPLSALVDRGRFFLPNQGTTELDKEKLSAFKGTRHRALVPLIAALNVLNDNVEQEDYKYVFDNRPKVLRELQKEFVSHIQQILAPKTRNREIARLIESSDDQLKALDGYEGTGANQRLRDVVKRLKVNELRQKYG
jgi:hypothetical protein